MRILLIGEDAAGIQTLQALRKSDHQIVAVMARPSRLDSRGETLWKLARRLGYNTWPAPLVKDANFAQQIRTHEIDIALNVHSLYLICPEVLMAPRLGSYNLHPGPLPRYAGLNSVCWAIYNGERHHGVTLHRMVPEIDAGAIAYQELVDIESEDSGLTLTTKCVDVGIPLVLRLLEAAAQGESSIPSVPQDSSKREYFGGDVPERGILHWNRPARRIVDFVRACDFFPFDSPWGQPRTTREGQEIQIVKGRLTGIPASMPPGTVGECSDWGVEVACADEWVLVEAIGVDGTQGPAADVLRYGDRLAAPVQPDSTASNAANDTKRRVASASVPIAKRDVDDPTPLTFTQEEMWQQSQAHPDVPLFNEPVTLAHVGELDVAALEFSLNEILRLDEAWRTSIALVDGKPMQVVHRDLRVSLPVVDLRHQSDRDREKEALRIAELDARQPLDVTRTPAFRVNLIRLGDREHRLCLTLSRMLLDRASIDEIFAPRLTSFYRAFSTGVTPPLFEPGIQHADFACWERKAGAQKDIARQLTHWQYLLFGQHAPLEWPNDHPRPPIQTHRGATRAFECDERQYRSIQALCEREGVSPAVALTAAFASVLHRYTGAPTFLFGTYLPGRRRREIVETSGCFEHLLPIRVDVSGNPTFQEVLSRIRTAMTDAESNSEVSFGQLVEYVNAAVDPSRHPLCQLTLTVRPPSPAIDREWAIRYADVSSGVSSFDLAIDVRLCENRIAGSVTYSADLFDDDTVARAMEHWWTLLDGAAADATQRLSGLPLLTEQERTLILRQWNSTEQAYPHVSIHQLFAEQAQRTPDAIAVEMDGRRMAYRELHRRAEQLSRHLQGLGIGPGNLIGLFVERSSEMVVALLGILKSGAAYIPLDPMFPKQRLELMLDDARPPIVITQESLRGALPPIDSKLVLIDADWSRIGEESAESSHDVARPEDLAYLLYTSGSTGRPKGVQIEHRAVVNFLLSMQREPGLQRDDVLVAVTTMSFDIAGLEMFLPLITGARLVIASSDVARDGARLAELLDSSRATAMQATPATWRMLIESGWEGGDEFKIMCGGEAMPPDLANELVKRGGSVWNLYGPTETTIWSTVQRVVDFSEGQVSIGRPIANTQIYLLDANNNPVPVGVTGDLYIGGAGVARGYFNRPELTAEKFVPDPFSSDPNARVYKTGDLARYRKDGSVEFLGRSDFQVKIRGFRIELGDIESTLAQHPDLTGAAVTVRDDGPGGARLVAYAIPQKDKAPAVDALREFLASRLPAYMVPGQFVFMDRFPLTPNGKLDRRALPVPALDASSHDDFVAPRNDVEAGLVTIWEELLGVQPISVKSSFFDLGGHSLLMAKLISRIEKRWGRKLTVGSIFETETVEQLAAFLADGEAPGSSSHVVPIQKSGSGIPFFCLGAGPMFRPLARLFGPEQPFLGVRVEPHEVAALKQPYDFVEIASIFAHKIRSYQPQGPYYIGGFCMTGVVGFEVCRQLMAQGHEIGRLVVFYGNTPGFFANTSRLFRYQLRLHSLLYHLETLRRLRGTERRQYLLDRIAGVKEKFSPAAERTAEKAPAELEDIGTVAARGYHPSPAAIPMVVFRPLEDPQGRFWDIQADWGAYTTARLDVHSTPGDHSTMFREPNVEALAIKVKPYLAADSERRKTSPGEERVPA